MTKLMEAMLEACAFIHDKKDIEDRIHESDGQRKLVHKLITDIIDCCHFVHAYTGKKFGSLSLFVHPVHASLTVSQSRALLATFAPTR